MPGLLLTSLYNSRLSDLGLGLLMELILEGDANRDESELCDRWCSPARTVGATCGAGLCGESSALLSGILLLSSALFVDSGGALLAWTPRGIESGLEMF